VVAAAVVFRGSHPEGLRDSKKLTAKRREALAEEIKRTCLAWAIGRASVPEIDSMNILRASHLAMQRAIAALSSSAELVLVDGNLLPRFDVPALAVVKGDDRVPEISAASIIAKVVRDAEMTELAGRYPGYGFERHKGYATAVHLEALDRLGPTPVHRQSFAPVRAQSAKRVPATETLAW
jgi:ribonuclease HII